MASLLLRSLVPRMARVAAPAARRAAPVFVRTEMTQAVVLNKIDDLEIRDIDVLDMDVGPDDVRIAMHRCGICQSDVEYYAHGRIGDFMLREPMILGHEGSGQVVEVGANVTHLKPGDKVAMEPGVPMLTSRETLNGVYNLCRDLRFWATPPKSPRLLKNPMYSAGHGCLRPFVVHPASFTFKLPDTLSYDHGALVEPLAVGMHAATKAGIRPGDVAVVIGAGPIGVLQALAALAGGCSKVFIIDISQDKLSVAASLAPGKIFGLMANENPAEEVKAATGDWGAEVIFECSGRSEAIDLIPRYAAPGATAVFVGCPENPAQLSIPNMQVVELTCKSIFRYRNVYPKAIELIASGQIDLGSHNLARIITNRFEFEDSVQAFDHARSKDPSSIKTMIHVSKGLMEGMY